MTPPFMCWVCASIEFMNAPIVYRCHLLPLLLSLLLITEVLYLTFWVWFLYLDMEALNGQWERLNLERLNGTQYTVPIPSGTRSGKIILTEQNAVICNFFAWWADLPYLIETKWASFHWKPYWKIEVDIWMWLKLTPCFVPFLFLTAIPKEIRPMHR